MTTVDKSFTPRRICYAAIGSEADYQVFVRRQQAATDTSAGGESTNAPDISPIDSLSPSSVDWQKDVEFAVCLGGQASTGEVIRIEDIVATSRNLTITVAAADNSGQALTLLPDSSALPPENLPEGSAIRATETASAQGAAGVDFPYQLITVARNRLLPGPITARFVDSTGRLLAVHHFSSLPLKPITTPTSAQDQQP